MKLIKHYIFIIYIVWVLSILFLSLEGYISFGHGLGDLYDLILLVFFTTLSSFFYFIVIKKNFGGQYWTFIFIVFLLLIMLIFILKLTLLRGSEYPWNGEFFL